MPAPRKPSADSSGGIVAMLKRIAPFLFRKDKPKVTAERPIRAAASAPSAKKSVASKKMKTSRKKKKTKPSRAAVTQLSARKKRDAVKHTSETILSLPSQKDTPASTGKLEATPVTNDVEKAAAEAAAEELKHEEGWMQKAAHDGKDHGEHKLNGWQLLLRRFGHAPKEAPKAKTETLDDKEIKNDSFLSHVESKSTNSVVGTASDEPQGAFAEAAAVTESQAEAPKKKGKETKQKGAHIVSAAELKEEANKAREAQQKLQIEAQKELQTEQARQANPGQQGKTMEPTVNRNIYKKPKNGLQLFLASLSHFGMGKVRMEFTQNMAMMLNAGLPLVDSLNTLLAETRNKSMKKVIKHIVETVENGSALWRAMDDEHLFSLHAIALVRIGEEAGSLAENMQYLSAQEEKDHALKSKVKMAMIYPSIVMTIMFGIVIILGTFVLPNLIGVITSLNVKLPLATRLVIGFTNVFTKYGTIVVPGSIGGFILIVILAKYSPLKRGFQWLMFKIPGIGALARQATIARFGVIMGGLLKAGVPVVDAAQSLVEVTPLIAYKKFYRQLLDHITIGDSFAKSFASIKGSDKLLPVSVQQLVVTGEKSGALADIMLKISEIYDKKASETAEKLPIILEPMLLLFIGGLVGTIAFAVIVPIYSIVGNVGNG